MSCSDVGDAVVCTMAQDVRATRQDERIMGARIDLEAEDAPRLTLILPQGLDLHAPVTLTPPGTPDVWAEIRPRVCQQMQCYGFLPLSESIRASLSDEIALRVTLTPFRGEAREVPLSLRGFEAALARLKDLAAS